MEGAIRTVEVFKNLGRLQEGPSLIHTSISILNTKNLFSGGIQPPIFKSGRPLKLHDI